METPATGMWGPGDFDGETTIDELRASIDRAYHASNSIMWSHFNDERYARVKIREAILDLAEDLDARGLVLLPEAQIMAGVVDLAGEVARNFTALGVPIPPDLAALITTANADLETGGE